MVMAEGEASGEGGKEEGRGARAGVGGGWDKLYDGSVLLVLLVLLLLKVRVTEEGGGGRGGEAWGEGRNALRSLSLPPCLSGIQ
jgi:hypothetical protein